MQSTYYEVPLKMTYSELVNEIGLAPGRYMNSRYDEAIDSLSLKKKFADDVSTLAVSEINRYHFFHMSWTIIREVLRSCLRQMKTQGLIEVTYSLRLMKKEYSETSEYIRKYNLTSAEHEQFIEIQESIIKDFHLSGLQELFYKNIQSGKIKDAQERYKEKLDDFVRNLKYEKYTALLIVSLTSKGKETPVDERYLNKLALQNQLKEKIVREDDFKKVIPAPAFEEFVRSLL